MILGLNDLIRSAEDYGIRGSQISRRRRLTLTSSARRYWLRGVRSLGTPKLVLTSPPYPSVHILYHRWQVGGRRETPAPFWLADLQDGHGASHYTFGSRTPFGMQNYFAALTRSFSAIREVIAPETVVGQLVAFSDVDHQLPAYLNAMQAAGYESAEHADQGELVEFWRRVPHRRWYMRVNDRDAASPASREILLLHRPASISRSGPQDPCGGSVSPG